jgi:murein DD-endopeptidase MepM/ murein hydrolase activator NlpD
MKKKDRRLTILVVPHNDSPPVTLSFPRWLVPSVFVSFVALLLLLGYVVVRYQQLSARYAEISKEQQVDLERGQGMRSTILTQQDDVKALSDEVRQVQSEMDSIRKLSEQVRQIMGLPKAEPPPAAASPTPQSLLNSAGGDNPGRAIGNAFIPAAPRMGMGLALESEQTLAAMRPSIPWAEKELLYLANQALVRLNRIDPKQRANQADLEAQLKLLAAAPSRWPVTGRISSDFGWRKALFDPGKREFHSGIDIAVWYFTPVKATKEGTVIVAGWMDGYGNAVEIQHEMGYATLYGHNTSLKVKVGQKVNAGDVIALSGQTGYASGPHVHYEIRINGIAVDPMGFLDLHP